VELSGLVKDGKTSPYPSAVNQLSQTWKCGSLRAKFLAESLWDLKESLESLGSGLVIRAGTFDGVLNSIIQHYAADQDGPKVKAVWMTEDVSADQRKEQELVSSICLGLDIKFSLYLDQKYFLHE
jgi:deoxyribodipyrimidine photo-lyase